MRPRPPPRDPPRDLVTRPARGEPGEAPRALRCSLALLLLLTPQGASACAACGCGDPTLTPMGQEKGFRNRVRLSLEQRLSGRLEGADLGDRALVGRTVLAVSYSPLARLSLGLTLPVAFQVSQPATAAPSGDGASATRWFGGLGDSEVLIRGAVYQDRGFSPRHLVWLLGGAKLPTGPRVNDNTGYPASEDAQPGSGALDLIGGASYGYFGGRLSAFATASYRHPIWQLRAYERAPQLGASALMQVALGARWALSGGVDAGYDQGMRAANGRALLATRGAIVSLTPGVLFSPRTDLLLRAALQVPVWQTWDGPRRDLPTGVLAAVLDL